MPHRIDVTKDVSIAAVGGSSFWWADKLAGINEVLTFLLVALSLVIAWVRFRRLVAKGDGPLLSRVWRALFGGGGPAA